MVVFPNGNEAILDSVTKTLGAGVTVTRSFAKVVPAGSVTGYYEIIGRAEIAGVSFDEDHIVYEVIP